jgi:Family of unknown function (DUF6335)
MAKKRARKPQAKQKSKSRGPRKRSGQARSKARAKARPKARSKPRRKAGSKVRAASRSRKTGAARRRLAAPASKRRGKVARKATLAVEPRRPLLRLDRERKQLKDADELVPGPPSSLDLDQSASAAKSGRRELQASIQQHTETSPALTGGDVDADWEEAYSVGDETPGGDNPTPDQDRVDDIGRALGIEYEDNEELKGAGKIEKRDRNRWELDPASAEDYTDRDKE